MNGKYEAAAIAVKNAEQALKTLKDFADIQYKAKGETMREQIADYIANVLADANYIINGCQHFDLALSRIQDHFVFYVNDSVYHGGFGTPIFSINTNGNIKYRNELEEDMMLSIIRYWDGFKEHLDFCIKATLKERTAAINNQLTHIAHVNERLSKWKV